jgi:eukaryotic-like serine/threonine-protein kinase
MAQSFDLATPALTGEAAQIVNPVGRMNGVYVNAAVAENGTLIYRTGGLADVRQLIWYDRGGKVAQTLPEQGSWGQVVLSRDGSRAVVQKAMDGGNRDLCIVDMARSLFGRFTFNKTIEADPVFSPDGSQIVFGAERDGVRDLYIKASNGATNETLLITSPETKIASDWSRDGLLLYSQRDPKTSWDLWILPMPEAKAKDDAGMPKVFLATAAAEDQARLSPDGHYVACRSNESGRNEVYVRSFPEGDGRWQISRDGGGSPRWRADGKELFFIGPNLSVMAADLPLGPSVAGVPRRLFSGRQTTIMDVAADGQRFRFADTLDEQVSSPIIVVLNALRE